VNAIESEWDGVVDFTRKFRLFVSASAPSAQDSILIKQKLA
jgi:hypothetical protein